MLHFCTAGSMEKAVANSSSQTHNVVEEFASLSRYLNMHFAHCAPQGGRHQSHPAEGMFSEQCLWKVLTAARRGILVVKYKDCKI